MNKHESMQQPLDTGKLTNKHYGMPNDKQTEEIMEEAKNRNKSK
ncbi:hypothetical protein [Fredinandcohnia sp. 179-A 10B2 NHS]